MITGVLAHAPLVPAYFTVRGVTSGGSTGHLSELSDSEEPVVGALTD